MASIVIAGDTSGSVTLAAPAVAGTTTLTLPATSATLATLTTPSFATTIGVGGATASASGSGITFPATQSGSSNANTLDDYEEGTWTPSLGGNATYDLQSGNYTKIGKVVTVNGLIRPTSLGTGSVNTLTGLPFSVASDSFGGIAYGNNFAASVYSVYLFMSGTDLVTYGFTAAASSTPVVNLFQSNARIYFTATYLTS